jgi:hypothetical protein
MTATTPEGKFTKRTLRHVIDMTSPKKPQSAMTSRYNGGNGDDETSSQAAGNNPLCMRPIGNHCSGGVDSS